VVEGERAFVETMIHRLFRFRAGLTAYLGRNSKSDSLNVIHD